MVQRREFVSPVMALGEARLPPQLGEPFGITGWPRSGHYAAAWGERLRPREPTAASSFPWDTHDYDPMEHARALCAENQRLRELLTRVAQDLERLASRNGSEGYTDPGAAARGLAGPD